ncbi:hypothetical protein [uncultured Adlercreutzia sp.]|uniref:hypothetical protein n=1 Tax=uncultured Adlercreutzia sp. TaxID=875803 RepID=UPI0025CFE9D9|nr:hypothetical protein [uncultured Adlercreutzia sp.]
MARTHFIKRTAAVVAVALVVSLGAAAGTAYAYYTDTSRANGMLSFKYDPNPPSTEVDEQPAGLNKVISVRNTGDVDAMVRVKVFVPSIAGVTVEFPDAAANGWTQQVNDNGEGWWYYTSPIGPGESTPSFTAQVTIADSVDQPFDIVVVQQCTSTKGYDPLNMTLGTFADGAKSIVASAFPAGDEPSSDQPQDGE